MESNTADYDIKHPPKGKQNAIIQLIYTGNKAGGSCTAFVIDDKRAITAAHCVSVDKVWLDRERPKLLLQMAAVENAFKIQAQRLMLCSLPACREALKQILFKLGEIRKSRIELIGMAPDVFIIRNMYKEDTGIRAHAFYKSDNARDYAIIKGNFKDFLKIPIRDTFSITQGESYRACGFAGGKSPAVCTDYVALRNYGFLYEGTGYFSRGMSGGPVIDKYGFAVGIISSVSKHTVLIDPLFGIFNFKFERPEAK